MPTFLDTIKYYDENGNLVTPAARKYKYTIYVKAKERVWTSGGEIWFTVICYLDEPQEYPYPPNSLTNHTQFLKELLRTAPESKLEVYGNFTVNGQVIPLYLLKEQEVLMYEEYPFTISCLNNFGSIEIGSVDINGYNSTRLT